MKRTAVTVTIRAVRNSLLLMVLFLSLLLSLLYFLLLLLLPLRLLLLSLLPSCCMLPCRVGWGASCVLVLSPSQA